MIITLKQNTKKNEMDIKVNREQRIMDTLLILIDGGILQEQSDLENNTIYSERLDKKIDVKMTYEQAEVYNGDILYLD